MPQSSLMCFITIYSSQHFLIECNQSFSVLYGFDNGVLYSETVLFFVLTLYFQHDKSAMFWKLAVLSSSCVGQ